MGGQWQEVKACAAASPILPAKAPTLRGRDCTPTFTVDQMRKNMGHSLVLPRTAWAWQRQ